MGCKVKEAITTIFQDVVADAVNPVFGMLGHSLLATPQLDTQSHVTGMWNTSLVIANSLVVLFVLAGGVLVMAHGSLHTRYAVKDIAPRLVVGVVAANLSLLVCGKAIGFANALAAGLLGPGVDPQQAARQLTKTFTQIFHASQHRPQPGGLPPITDPDEIYPGQHVTIPPPHPHHKKTPPAHLAPPRTPGHRPPAQTPGTPTPTTSSGSSTATPPSDPSPTASPAPGRTPRQTPRPTPSQAPGGAPPPAATSPPTSAPHTPAPATPRPTPTGPTTPPTRPPAPPPGTPRTSSPTPSADAPPPPSAAPSTPPSARSPSQPPATRPASPTPSKSPGAPAPPHSDHKHTDQGPVTVALRTGGYVGLGLAAAISIALALTRAHRRHQRPHVEEWPPVYEPEPEPPEPVAQIRRAHLQALAHTGDAMPTDENLVADDFATPEPTRITLGTRTTPHPSPDHDHPDPERREPGREVEVAFEVAGLSIGLTGPGTVDAVRAVFVELLARSRHGRVELVLTHTDAATLLDGTGIAPAHLAEAVDGLTLLPDASEVAAHLETQILHRRRMMTHHDVRDVPALRTADPAESLPAIIVIATLPARDEALEAIVTFGARYCVGGLILGPWPPGPTLDVDTDGTITHTTSPDPAARPYGNAGPWGDADAWTGVRLFHLAPAEVTGLLQTIRTATGKLDTPPREKASPRTHEVRPPQSPTPRPPDIGTGHDQPAQRDRPDQFDPATAAGGGLPVPATDRVVAAPGHPPADRPPRTEPDQDRPVLVRVLGPVRVQARGQAITTGIRTNGYTLLAYLALHPHGVTRDQGITALWPEDPPGTAPRLFHTAVNNLRRALRTATGLHEPMFITLAQNRYRLDPALIDVDLWRLQGILETAQQADDDTTRLPALRQIPDLYTGELATDIHAEWAETRREQLRRHATDALVYLARLTQNTDPDQALAALEQAITHDPYTEPIYRSIMRIQARQHRPDAVRRTYRLLETRLAELDIDPAPETQQLVAELTRPRRARLPAGSSASASGRGPGTGGGVSARPATPLRRRDGSPARDSDGGDTR